jgi:hypothetical protein
MHEIEIDDKIFNPLGIYSIDVSEESIDDFKEMVKRDDLPNEIVVDTIEGVFKLNKDKKEFRILKRNHYDQEIYLGYPNQFQVDFQVFIAYKVAKLSGYNVFLEAKYSN